MAAHQDTVETSTGKQTRLQSLFVQQRAACALDPMPDAETRIGRLKRLKRALLRHRDTLVKAASEDFGHRSPDETLIGDVLPCVLAIDYAIRNTHRWMKRSRRRGGLLLVGTTLEVVYQPKGVVGIISPWNYPVQLAINPLAYAIAAGNRVLVKVSEHTPRVAEALAAMITDAAAADEIAVVTGGIEVGEVFSKLPFDHLLFTGSTKVGRAVMRSAADNLTSVTLELGGKSPALIAPDARMPYAAERICFGKMFNAGQTCVAPDYVLCPESRLDEFTNAFKKAFGRMYPSLGDNPDYSCIVDQNHYERLEACLDDARAQGANATRLGDTGSSGHPRKMPLYLLTGVAHRMRVMQEEIFGPLLPVVPYTELDDALRQINSGPRPLVLYLFTDDEQVRDRVVNETHSGAVSVNETLLHCAADDLPFGGIGESGMGQYHGREGFLTFSHPKAIMRRSRWLDTGRVLFPPYRGALRRWLYRLFLKP